MGKVYQQSIIEKTNKIIQILTESRFFKDFQISDTRYAETLISDILTEKFIIGELDYDEKIFEERQFESLLKQILAGSVVNDLIKKGLVNSVENESSEEVFFLTKKGKKFLEKNKI